MNEANELLTRLDRMIEAMHRIADAGFAIAEAVGPGVDEDGDPIDDRNLSTPQGRGMGMG